MPIPIMNYQNTTKKISSDHPKSRKIFIYLFIQQFNNQQYEDIDEAVKRRSSAPLR